jgi:predicted nucleic acid-binding protein
MKTVFVDTAFWIAGIHPADQYHRQATLIAEELEDAFWVTTDIVLIETLNAFSDFGAF